MRNLFVFFLFIFITNSIYSQDLIVTNEGDSINCKITKVKRDYVYFTFIHKDEVRSTLLPFSGIITHQFNYFQNSIVPKDKVIGCENYKHLRIAVNGGFSYQIAEVAKSVPSDFKDYIEKLKSGYHFGGDLTYYFTEPLGFGFKYFLFKSSNSLDNIYSEDSYGNRKFGKLSDDLTVSFIGPSFSTRILNENKRNSLIMNMSLGYLGYTNDKVLIDRFKITGSTMGISCDFGYDIGISENLLLGFQISFLSGYLFKYNINDGTRTETIKLDNANRESLNRIDLSVGLRFCK